MGKKSEVPITPAVLEWAIQEGGYSTTSFSERIGVDLETLTSWLEGETRPGKTEFAEIVETLRRPSALYFLPAAPDSTVPPELRSEPEGGRPLGPDELRKVRSAVRLQRVLSQWLAQAGHEPIEFPFVEATAKPAVAGEAIRKALGISVEEQISWESANVAFRSWREAIAQLRIQVLLLQLGQEGIRGFSSWDEYLPIIAANTGYNQQARVFTIFHELAHLLARTQAACTDITPRTNASQIERWCESVASEALLPADDVRETAMRLPADNPFELVKGVADAYSVSLRAAALRIGDLGLVDDPGGLYRLIDRNAVGWDRKKGGGRSTEPRTRVVARLTEVGAPVVLMVDEALANGFLHERDIADYLDLEPREFEEAKSRLEPIG